MPAIARQATVRPPMPAQARVTRSVRATIEPEARRLLQEIRSARKVKPRDKRKLEAMVAPLAAAADPNTSTAQMRQAVEMLDAFRSGLRIGGGDTNPGLGRCLQACAELDANCTDHWMICAIKRPRCVANCL